MLKLFTVSVKSHIDHPLPVWYKKIKMFLEQIHYLPNLIVTFFEKKTDSYPFPSTISYCAFLFLHVVYISIFNQRNRFTF